ncbi:hypothetical protein AVEN_100862-1 [Araneus ventricosus]|uniref:Uncharacterized protein n=1 Tax=Araneus ventricosus TaxID=182803 RepID=A0A4Y2AW86_ARAVE|nr:hypothetical protein AVEN_100862-1 [Araneus ventricosus]
MTLKSYKSGILHRNKIVENSSVVVLSQIDMAEAGAIKNSEDFEVEEFARDMMEFVANAHLLETKKNGEEMFAVQITHGHRWVNVEFTVRTCFSPIFLGAISCAFTKYCFGGAVCFLLLACPCVT